jgi:hypothetical protein
MSSGSKTRQLESDDYCLQLVLIKDLSYKYGRYFGKVGEIDSSQKWCLIGEYHYLEVKKCDSLSKLHQDRSDISQMHSWMDSRKIVLVPFKDPKPPADFISTLESPVPNDNPFLAMISITTSPIAYELNDGPANGLRLVSRLINLLQEYSRGIENLPQIAFLGSLSGPDLIVMGLPRNPSELKAMHVFTRLTRDLKLSMLCNDSAEAQKTTSPACVLVVPTLAFRLGSLGEVFSKESFKKAEEECGLNVHFSLRVDCGHEMQVIQEMKKRCTENVFFDLASSSSETSSAGHEESESKARTSWCTHTITGRFHHFEDLARAWEELWFGKAKDGHSWRSYHLLGSITTLSMYDEAYTWSPGSASWEIDGEIRVEIDKIDNQLTQFGTRYLNVAQGMELKNLFNSFKSCFFRQDLLGTARDLFPFFRQLGLALSDLEMWDEYLSPTQITEEQTYELSVVRASDFREQVQTLLTYLNRAVRNRIEHRSSDSDPPYPQTLRIGTPKVISAYTYIVNLCSELFRQTNENKVGHPALHDTTHFAACVQAGPVQRVECLELFENVRQFAECGHQEAMTASPSLLSQRDGKKWSARLFLLTVPIESMLRPELSIVHCLHEMSELSDWISLKKCKELRRILNHWIFSEVITVFQWELTNILLKLGRDHGKLWPETQKRIAVFARSFVPYCAAIYELETVNSKEEIGACIDKMKDSAHPIRLTEFLKSAIYVVGGEKAQLDHFHKILFSADSEEFPFAATWCPEISTSDELRCGIEIFEDLASEVLGDIGMWSALFAILPDNEGMSSEQRFQNLAQIFDGIFVIAQEDSGNKQFDRLVRMIVHRFAIQAAAILGPSKDFKQKIIEHLSSREDLSKFKDKAAEYLARCDDIQQQFGLEEGLTAMLHNFDVYSSEGKKNGLGFVDISKNGTGPILDAFRRAWSNPNINNRLQLLKVLWSGSTRFALPKLFKRVDEVR